MCLAHNRDQNVLRFANFQLDLRSGRNLPPHGYIKIPEDLFFTGSTIESLIHHIYPSISSNPHPPPTYFIHHMILTPRNEDVHVVNRNIIDVFQASAANTKVYQSADSAIIREQESDEILVEFLNAINSINVSGLPVSKLTLKAGCPVMLLWNLGNCCILEGMSSG